MIEWSNQDCEPNLWTTQPNWNSNYEYDNIVTWYFEIDVILDNPVTKFFSSYFPT
jgi:hypothetical protein